MKIEQELARIIKSKGLNHDLIELSITLKNSENIDENIQIIASVTTDQLSTMPSYIEIFSNLNMQLIQELFKSIDEMEYFRLFHPSHYSWLNSDEYAEWQKVQQSKID